MPLTMPTLDDRTYADLLREGLELIPAYAPEWTNHNAADPGVTLVELFAYLTEIYLYRVDRISDAHKARFLKLLVGGAGPLLPAEPLDRQLQQAVLEARRPFRAVSAGDFERLAIEATRDGAERTRIGRACCFARRNLAASTPARRRDWPGHVSVVFIPDDPWLTDAEVQAVRTRIEEYIEPRRLLTSRVHVVGPRYVDAAIRIRVAISPGFVTAAIEQRLRLEVERLFDPRRGGPEHSGWPLGRSVYASDIYQRVGTIEGVSRLVAVDFDVQDSWRLRRSEMGEVVGVQLEAGELLRAAGITCECSPDRPDQPPPRLRRSAEAKREQAA